MWLSSIITIITESASSALGQQLCATLFSADALSATLALSALAHALLANVEQRTELLRVQLGTGTPPPESNGQSAREAGVASKTRSQALLELLATACAKVRVRYVTSFMDKDKKPRLPHSIDITQFERYEDVRHERYLKYYH